MLLLATIAGLAFLARLIPVLRGGGLDSVFTYDDAVYYSSAIAFVHGEIPYRDFLLVHPPGILFILAPLASLGALFSDATAFEIARLAFMVLGACNAVLVALVARRMGWTAGVCAGALYAVWDIAAFVERTTWLVETVS